MNNYNLSGIKSKYALLTKDDNGEWKIFSEGNTVIEVRDNLSTMIEEVKSSKRKYFNPEGDLMKQLSQLDKTNAKQWYKEYLDYHNGEDQGVSYVIGYFTDEKRKFLKKEFGLK